MCLIYGLVIGGAYLVLLGYFIFSAASNPGAGSLLALTGLAMVVASALRLVWERRRGAAREQHEIARTGKEQVAEEDRRALKK